MGMHGPDLCDVIADHHWMEAYGIREMPEDYAAEEQEYLGHNENGEGLQPSNEQELQELQQLPAIDTFHPDVHSQTEIKHEVSKSPKSRTSSRKSSAKSKRSTSTAELQAPMPLTMNEI